MKDIKNNEKELNKHPKEVRAVCSKTNDYMHRNPSKELYCWTRRFLLKHVGKSYNKTYSEYLEALKTNDKGFALIGFGLSAKERFNMFFDTYREHRYYSYCEFTIVDGIIRKRKPRWQKTKKIELFEYPEGHKYVYKLSSDLKNNPLFKDMVYSCCGVNFFNRLSQDLITEDEAYSLLSDFYTKCKYNHIFKKVFQNISVYNDTLNIQYLFDVTDIAPKVKIENPESLEKKKFYEKKDAKNKVRRENERQKEEILKTLISDIENEGKRRITEKNRVDIERLGFDEGTSFKGEPYHGQKRKKKK